MKLLLDANLSWRLINYLESYFPESQHVRDISLQYPASDVAIWAFARENNFVIVTNDEDFLHLLLQKGFPPKVVLLKTGNQSSKFIQETLMRRKPDIESLVASTEYGLLEIYG
ncbi:MAG: DUF5615 family PIN-like protein [Bacteroidota bacterium]